jgi:hypothetical protein
LGWDLTPVGVRDASDIDRAVATAARESNVGLIVLPGSLTLLHRKSIIALAAQHHLPAVYPFRYHVAAVATARSMSLASLTPTGVRSQPKRENQMSV